ncbi:MAG TPA: protein kinase, partial [Pseudomonadota bacterium]|nr:protein kinase [Pseudomonadota bacterium]
MGVVYEAEHHRIGRRVAIKLLHRQFGDDEQIAQRFLNEARTVNIIRHRGLVEIFEYGQLTDGTLYFVMEYLEGQTLRQRLTKRSAAFPVAEAVSLAAQMARALAAAHAKGIIHREQYLSNTPSRKHAFYR